MSNYKVTLIANTDKSIKTFATIVNGSIVKVQHDSLFQVTSKNFLYIFKVYKLEVADFKYRVFTDSVRILRISNGKSMPIVIDKVMFEKDDFFDKIANGSLTFVNDKQNDTVITKEETLDSDIMEFPKIDEFVSKNQI